MSASETAFGDQWDSGVWQVDPARSRVEFRTKAMWGLATVKGHFASYHGSFEPAGDPAITLTIDATSLDTGNRKRDQHLRDPDFFDTADHPTVEFTSNSVEQRGDTLKVRGRLSARGTSILIELDAQIRHHDGGLDIEAATEVSHRELGMTYSPLKTIPPTSKLLVTAHMIRTEASAS